MKNPIKVNIILKRAVDNSCEDYEHPQSEQ